MSNNIGNVHPISIEKELKQSYLDYAMSVIVGRALPDVRDGLKPVHRRVLFAMKMLSNNYNSPYKKSARVVGDVIGKYHPHGDTAVYDTMVRMAQHFSLRYPLIDGQGNFGSVDGDSPAAMRYTEVRMKKIAHSLLIDLDKETVNFSPNYDESEFIPDVMPTRVPNLLVNGSSGIAVGMATNIPPHNLTEVINGVIALIDNEALTIDELMEYIPAPDFPTSGFINGTSGIVDGYKTGRGRVIMRAKADISVDKFSGKNQIIITELPYQVNKAKLIEKIAELSRDKKIEGISELRDESDKDGIRIVFDLKRNEVPEVLLNNLYSQTQLQLCFGMNMVALVNGEPKLLNLKEFLEAFIKHRKEVVTRRTIYELRKARERAHILEGLAVALVNIDEVIKKIKSSKTPADAKALLLEKSWNSGIVPSLIENVDNDLYRPENLSNHYGVNDSGYNFSDVQLDSILALRLNRLTGLEQDKIIDEFKTLIVAIKGYIDILKDLDLLMKIIKQELEDVKLEFGDSRRSKIMETQVLLNYEDLITQEDMVITLSYDGYVKTQPLSVYNSQRRGGKGKSATKMKDEDFIVKLAIASTHDTMLCFSTTGKVYWSKVYEFPQASRISKGKPINNILPLDKNEKITAMLPVSEYTADKLIFMATKNAVVKRVCLELFSRPRKGGIYALGLKENDELMNAIITDGTKDIMMFSDAGKAIRFEESQIRAMGRTATGVRGMRLNDSEKLVGILATEQDSGVVITATENGYGKRTDISQYRKTARGSKGVKSIITSDRNGQVVGAALVEENDDIMLMTNQGTLVRTKVEQIREMGRSTQGVTLIKVDKNEKLVMMRVIENCNDEYLEDENLSDENIINDLE